MRVHQLCARVEFGDAVSNHVIEIDRALGSWGYETDVFASTMDAFGAEVACPDEGYSAHIDSPGDILIYHYSLFCPNYRQYLDSRNRKILVYHNITPPEYFAPYDRGVAEFCRKGRGLLPELKGCDLALGDSEFNRMELVQAGFDPDRTGVLPIFVDYQGLRSLAARGEQAGRGGAFRVLFVGRAVPNKRLEDLIRAFYYYHRCVNADSRLDLVGASWVDRYDAQLRWLVDSLALWDSVDFPGRVGDAELAAYYSSADAFLSMSEHEGFAVPLVESMAFDLPVVAYSSTAIPYTLEGAGLSFRQKDYPMVGELLESLRTDGALREKVLAGQRARLEAFSPDSVRAALQAALRRVEGAAA
ncbi:MAG: glycosyltransferase family 4 protein [Actinobacteria bacterium]|nr:glycosyltransferase family 4 protein [Actinomycetota bacterium]MBU1942415.1 glycosyltransferase family 4 protein [Actinomycetota bacterium]MBU2686287.1 glycosyltransferase family 4 protein [Actinomycetota bacterium]